MTRHERLGFCCLWAMWLVGVGVIVWLILGVLVAYISLEPPI